MWNISVTFAHLEKIITMQAAGWLKDWGLQQITARLSVNGVNLSTKNASILGCVSRHVVFESHEDLPDLLGSSRTSVTELCPVQAPLSRTCAPVKQRRTETRSC